MLKHAECNVSAVAVQTAGMAQDADHKTIRTYSSLS
jgi:hypothetical protein